MKDNIIEIKGVKVDKNAVDLKKIKSVSSLKKLKIFSHLDEQDEANEELAKALGITSEEETPEVGNQQ